MIFLLIRCCHGGNLVLPGQRRRRKGFSLRENKPDFVLIIFLRNRSEGLNTKKYDHKIQISTISKLIVCNGSFRLNDMTRSNKPLMLFIVVVLLQGSKLWNNKLNVSASFFFL